jgi:hypothetical protein
MCPNLLLRGQKTPFTSMEHHLFNYWDNVTKCPLLNVMFACPNGDVFLGAFDTTRECKDAHYICNALIRYIETIRVNNVVQICIYNALNM